MLSRHFTQAHTHEQSYGAEHLFGFHEKLDHFGKKVIFSLLLLNIQLVLNGIDFGSTNQSFFKFSMALLCSSKTGTPKSLFCIHMLDTG